MRITLDKIPQDVTEEQLIAELNKRIDSINMMLSEIDEDNLSQAILNRLRGEKQ